jgi:hypothetical protein
MINKVYNTLFYLYSKPHPNPPLKQIRGGHKSVMSVRLSPFPYCLREGVGGRVKNKRYLTI